MELDPVPLRLETLLVRDRPATRRRVPICPDATPASTRTAAKALKTLSACRKVSLNWRPARRVLDTSREARISSAPLGRPSLRMWWSKVRSPRPRDAQRRIGALLGIWALFAQTALLPLHDWAVSRDPSRTVQEAHASADTAPQVGAPSRRSPVHDASDCPVCRTLVHARRFLSPLAPSLAAPSEVQRHDATPAAVIAFATIARATSPRAPPRLA